MRKIVFFMFLVVVCSSLNVSANLIDDSAKISSKIQNFTSGSDVVIVFGSNINNAEKLAFNFFKKEYPEINDLTIVSDIDIGILDSNKTLFLIGGPSQNSISSLILDDLDIFIDKEDLSVGYISFITLPNKKIILFSDKLGYDNVVRTSSARSPLSNVLPEEFVPVAATMISVLFLWLSNFFVTFFKKILSFFISSKVMKRVKKKKLGSDYVGFKIFNIRIKLREWISIFLSAAVFALAISYTYISKAKGVILFILTNIVVNTIIYAIRHISRLVMDKKHNIHTEYVFWYFGALFTIISGFLGNTFSLSGYTFAHKKSEQKEEGRIQFYINLFTFFAFIIFLTLNFVSPNKVFQMAALLSLSIAFIQMLPFEPFGGKYVYQWSKSRWFLMFIPMLIAYIITNFLL